MKDRLFIFLTVLLIILFGAEIFSNLSALVLDRHRELRPKEGLPDFAQVRPRSARQPEDITEILNRLKEAGLEPREAKYYEVIK